MRLTGYLGDNELVLDISDEDIGEFRRSRELVQVVVIPGWVQAFGHDDGSISVEPVAFFGLTGEGNFGPLNQDGFAGSFDLSGEMANFLGTWRACEPEAETYVTEEWTARIASAKKEVEAFNTAVMVGQPVEIDGKRTITRSKAQLFSGGVAVVWVADRAKYVLVASANPVPTGANS